MRVWSELAVAAALALAAHELGHWGAARCAGIRVRGVDVGAGREVARLGRVRLRAWPVGAAVLLDGAALGGMGVPARLLAHASGPLANLALAWLLAAAGPHGLGAGVNLALAGANLLPLPALDGGWIVSAVAARLSGRPFEEEREAHGRLRRLSFALAFAIPLALTAEVAGVRI